MHLPQLPTTVGFGEARDVLEPTSQVEQHLRAALAHVAIAEAFTTVDGLVESEIPAVDRLAHQIRKLVETISPEVVLLTVPAQYEGVPEAPVPHGAETRDFLADGSVSSNGSANGSNGAAVHDGPPAESDRSGAVVGAEEVTYEGFSGLEEGSGPLVSGSADMDIVCLPEPGVRPESLGPPLRTVTIKANNVVVFGGKEITFSPKQILALSELIKNPGIALPSVDASRGLPNFASHLKAAKEKLEEAGLSGVLLKYGDKSHTSWKLAEDVGFVDTREKHVDSTSTAADIGAVASEPAPVAEDVETVSESGIDPEQKTEQPQLEFDQQFMADGKLRRHGIIRITNIDEVNSWTEQTNPYGHLPMLTLNDKGFLFGKNTHQLSDDQRELMNILLTHIGRPLSVDEIFAAGFRVFDEGPTHRLDELQRAARRFSDFIITSDRDRLLLGDIKQGSGLQLNPKLLFEYQQPEAEAGVKKKI